MVKKITLSLSFLIVVVVAYNLINQIIYALRSGERLSKEAEEVYKLEAKNKEFKKRLSQVQSVQFLEEQARDKLGLAKKGETLVIIPQEKIDEILGASKSAQEARLPNWLGWFKVFFH